MSQKKREKTAETTPGIGLSNGPFAEPAGACATVAKFKSTENSVQWTLERAYKAGCNGLEKRLTEAETVSRTEYVQHWDLQELRRAAGPNVGSLSHSKTTVPKGYSSLRDRRSTDTQKIHEYH